MLSIYLEAGTQGTTSTAKDATIVALHVLTRALFGGKSHAFTNELEIQVQDGRTMSYRDTLGVILRTSSTRLPCPTVFFLSRFCQNDSAYWDRLFMHLILT
jgi:hypothetical protein